MFALGNDDWNHDTGQNSEDYNDDDAGNFAVSPFHNGFLISIHSYDIFYKAVFIQLSYYIITCLN